MRTLLQPGTGLALPSSSAAVGLAPLHVSRPPDRIVLGRRMGRIGFGVVLVGGGLLTTANAAMGSPIASDFILASAWSSALSAMIVLQLLTRLACRALDPGRIEDHCLAASLAWPVVGIALTLPVSLHGLIVGISSTASPVYPLATGAAFVLALWMPTRMIVAHERSALAASA